MPKNTKSYRLKPGQENFQVVDGPLAGRKFVRGRSYTEIPKNEAHRFEPVPEVLAPKTMTGTDSKKEA